jgi:hypothetical protein
MSSGLHLSFFAKFPAQACLVSSFTGMSGTHRLLIIDYYVGGRVGVINETRWTSKNHQRVAR